MTRLAIIGLLGFLFLGALYAQDSDFEQFMQQEEAGFEDFQDAEANYEAEITAAYEEYVQEQEQAYQDFREEVERKWDTFRGNTREEFVNYDGSLDSRGAIDFKDGEVEVEVIEDADNPDAEADARTKIEAQVKFLVKEKDDKGEVVSEENADNFAKDVAQKKDVKVKTYQAQDGMTRRKYSVTVKMVPDHVAKRASVYKDDVLKEAKRFEIDPRVAFAVMQTESFFNPKARSHIPAYGLMQLVPASGARDAYLFVYKQDKLLTADYLYQPANNVELGCAYLGKVKTVYFRNIEDDESAYSCTIAAYNTGPGNVAKAITGTTSLNTLVTEVNAHDANWVYKKLLSDLPYKET